MSKTVQIPDDREFLAQGGIPWWRAKHNAHFSSPEHVSDSAFAEFFGSVDHGCRLHIPAAGKERDEMNAKAERDAQAKRCHALRQPPDLIRLRNQSVLATSNTHTDRKGRSHTRKTNMGLLDMIGEADGTPSANYLKGGRHVVKISRATFREPSAKIPRASFRVDGEILKSTNPKHQAQVGQTGTMNLGFKFPNDDLARMRRALAAAGTSQGIGTGEDSVMGEAEAAKRATELTGDKQPLVGAIVVIEADEKPKKAAREKDPATLKSDDFFTTYEVSLPTDKDLDGLNL